MYSILWEKIVFQKIKVNFLIFVCKGIRNPKKVKSIKKCPKFDPVCSACTVCFVKNLSIRLTSWFFVRLQMWHQIICTDLRDSFLHTVNHLLLAKLCILPKQQFFIFRSDLFRPFSKFVNRLIFSDVLNDLLRNKRDIIRAALNERL